MDISQLANLFSNRSVIDLSQVMEADTPVWFTHPHFYCTEHEHYDKGDGFFLNNLSFGEHTGTHVDAPAHFIKGGSFIDEQPLLQYSGRGVRIDASRLPPRGLVTVAMITDWEAVHGPIQQGDIVLLDVGYAKFWSVKPNHQQFLADWPGLSAEGAAYLVERKVKAVGTDAISLDAFGQDACPAHDVLLRNNVMIIENLNNLSRIKDFCLFIALPLKIKGGSGSPVRAIALV